MDLSFHIEPAPAYSVIMLISTHVIGGPGKGLMQIVPELERNRLVAPQLLTFHRPGAPDSLFIAGCRERGVSLDLLAQSFNCDPRPLGPLIARMRAGRAILQTHGYKENVFGLVIKAITGCPWVAFLHGTTDENLKVRMYHRMDRQVVRFADRIVSVSRALARRTVSPRYYRKVRIVPNAIEKKPYEVNQFLVSGWKRRHNLGRQPIIVTVGRLSPEKGHQVLLESARELVQAGFEFKLLIVGDGPQRAELERLTERLGIKAQVQFLGQRSDMDMIYAAADLFVLPSFKEGMPNVLLEAMAHGLPMVATRVGGIPEMVRDGRDALLVPARDMQALRFAMERLLRFPDRARELGRNGRAALFPRFSVARRVERLEQVYRELAQGAKWQRYL